MYKDILNYAYSETLSFWIVTYTSLKGIKVRQKKIICVPDKCM